MLDDFQPRLQSVALAVGEQLVQLDQLPTSHGSKVRGGGLNPGSTQVRTLGLDQRGGAGEYQHQEPGFNPGSTQV